MRVVGESVPEAGAKCLYTPLPGLPLIIIISQDSRKDIKQ